MRRAIGLGALVFIVVAGQGCWFFTKKVSAEDCTRLGDQYEKVLKEEAEGVIKKCKKGKDKAFVKAANKDVAKNIKTSKDPLVDTCKGTASVLTLKKADDECFTKATSTEDWEKCKFEPTSALFLFGGTPEASRANWAGICASAGAASAGDDDDDDDKEEAPAKKKKKKGDDDDDDDDKGW